MSAACQLLLIKELLALITTLHLLYDTSHAAEAHGRAFGSYCGVASIIILSKVLDLLAKLNCMQRQTADFSRLLLT